MSIPVLQEGARPDPAINVLSQYLPHTGGQHNRFAPAGLMQTEMGKGQAGFGGRFQGIWEIAKFIGIFINQGCF